MTADREAGETLGDRVRKLRMERGLSLAKVAGGDFSRAFLNQVELNKSRPSVRVLRVIADRLDAPVDYLLDGSTPSLDREIALEKEGTQLLEEQRGPIAAHGDQHRLERLDAILGGVSYRLDAEAHTSLGVALLRDGDGAAALEHFRAARILLGG